MNRIFHFHCIGGVLGVALLALAGAASAADLTEFSIEQLLDVEVSSAGRKPQKLEDTATAIHVITQEDIRRSGMTSIPELLRRVPGMQVAQINGNAPAIGSRGFSQRYSNKLLVLLDGRTLYTPTFSGVYWDAQDVVLEDIERIEVIRGPGGTLWGANAVNGVINITTRSAAATQGGMLNAGTGNYERQGTVRYGGAIGETGHYRVYARSIAQDNFPLATGAQAHDQRDMQSAGFRADWTLSGGNTVMAQGGLYDMNADQTILAAQPFPPATLPLNINLTQKSGNLLLNWKHALSAASEWSLKFYCDYYERQSAGVGASEKRDTCDADFQHRLLLAENHDVVWGLGYRQTDDELKASFIMSFIPPRRRDNTISAFFQDEIALGQGSDRNKLHLILGSKFEHNDYSGFEYQPNLRLHWKVDEQQSAWTAVSRAVRSPSRIYSDVRYNVVASPGAGGVPTLMRFMGNPAVKSEELLAYEAGYRVRPSERLYLDVTGFYNDYRNLMTLEPLAPFAEAGPPPRVVVPQQLQNKASATTHGLEWSSSWQPTEKWQLKAAYSWLKMNIRPDPGSAGNTIDKAGNAPQHQLQFHTHHALNAQTNLDFSLYYVDKLPDQDIPAYTRLDVRWGWHPQRDLELSLAARNLLDRQHPEFVSTLVGPVTSEVPRSIYAAATWRF